MFVCWQVLRLEAELRQARQAGDAAETKASAAAKDLRLLSSLEEEVRRLRAQVLTQEKRRLKDTKTFKDAELRASTLDSRLSERDGQVDVLQKQLAAVRTCQLPQGGALSCCCLLTVRFMPPSVA